MRIISGIRTIIIVLIILCIFNSSYVMGEWMQSGFKIAADFNLYDLNGEMVSLSDFKGKKQLMLFFWTTWCPHCRTQIRSLNKLTEELKGKDVIILAINTGENSGRIKAFLGRHPISSAILLDRDTGVARNYNVVGVPTFVIVDLDGSIKFHDNCLPRNFEELL